MQGATCHEGMPHKLGSLNAMEERQEAQASQDQAAAVPNILRKLYPIYEKKHAVLVAGRKSKF